MRKLLRSQTGDTIVEVLISMAVISLVLAGAYVSTNQNTKSVLDAQEHGQALKIVETQIEFLRAAAQATTPYNFLATNGNNKCFDQTGTATDNSAVDPQHPNKCVLGPDGSPAVANQEPAYTVTVTSPSSTSNDPYTVNVTWDTPTGTSANDGNITMYYRPD